MSRRSRPEGRHRDGADPGPWRRRPWDREAHAEAQRLDEQRTGWTVMYGTGSRRFYAMATWPVPEPLVVEARTTVELTALMCEEEMAMVARREVVAPSQDRPRLA